MKDPEHVIDVARRLDWVSVTRALWEFFHGQRNRHLAPEIQKLFRWSWNVSSAPTPTCREMPRARKMANRRIEEQETKIGAVQGPARGPGQAVG